MLPHAPLVTPRVRDISRANINYDEEVEECSQVRRQCLLGMICLKSSAATTPLIIGKNFAFFPSTIVLSSSTKKDIKNMCPGPNCYEFCLFQAFSRIGCSIRKQLPILGPAHHFSLLKEPNIMMEIFIQKTLTISFTRCQHQFI